MKSLSSIIFLLLVSTQTMQRTIAFRKHKLASWSTSLFSSVVASSLPTTSEEKLGKLREEMKKEGIDAFVIPTEDPHMSEYTAPFYNRRSFISGFTGSAGTALVTSSNAYLWTDGRYHTQAEIELDNSWVLMRQGLKDVPTLSEFLSTNLTKGSTVGIDPFLHAAGAVKKVEETLSPKDIHIKQLQSNLIDSIWIEDRPSIPSGSIRIHPLQYAGMTVSDKVKEIRKQMTENSCVALVLTTLDEIAWTYNIRGTDVPCVPVTISYAMITPTEAFFFIDDNKVPIEVATHLQESGVTVRPYMDIVSAVMDVTKDITDGSKFKIWFDEKNVNKAIFSLVPATQRLEKTSPVTTLRAIKNTAELLGMRACHRRDGAAMAEFFSQLEVDLAAGVDVITEVDIDVRSTACRRAGGMFMDLSFPTIAGVGSNGAIIHYRAEEKNCKILTNNDLLLLDSGAQYEDGTTDVTRTMHTGTPTDIQREMFTRVLKGNIAVDSSVFPAGTAGCLLDSFARQHLWAIGEDFGHGTGHGVGAALSVHEGPHSISRVLNPQPLIPGMIVSNEPGFYLPGHFGIRIENLLVVVERTDMKKFGGRPFLGFEKLTLIPLQKKMMKLELLNDIEKQWINSYHSRVWEEVSPLLVTDRARKWLQEYTSPL